MPSNGQIKPLRNVFTLKTYLAFGCASFVLEIDAILSLLELVISRVICVCYPTHESHSEEFLVTNITFFILSWGIFEFH